MKTMTKLAAAFCAMLLVLLAAFPALAATTDLKLVGGAAGLVLLPAEGKLFDLQNMSPGDTRTATITIKNDYSKWYDLWMRAEDVTAEKPSLFEVMELTVLYRGKELYRGPVAGFAGDASIYLGRYHPGESGELTATVHLPGPATGNEYQGKRAGVKWIFTAQSSGEVLPPTGGEWASYVLLGSLALLAGIQLASRRQRLPA